MNVMTLTHKVSIYENCDVIVIQNYTISAKVNHYKIHTSNSYNKTVGDLLQENEEVVDRRQLN